MSSLLFIDTNIWLDFYRINGKEKGLSILNHINDNHSLIISSFIVEMEFNKQRQSEILRSYNMIKIPSIGNYNVPSFLLKSRQFKSIEKNHNWLEQHCKELKNKLESAIQTPSRSDPVYKVARRLFKSNTKYNLNYDNEKMKEIIELAKNRFILGFPPRKSRDTSIGDAVNWEWIIKCAKDSRKNVVIVSRDFDYGNAFFGKTLINDWLKEEFKKRVTKNRTIKLTERLTEGLKQAQIHVSKDEEKIENDLLEKKKYQNINNNISDSPFSQNKTLGEILVDWMPSPVTMQASQNIGSLMAKMLKSCEDVGKSIECSYMKYLTSNTNKSDKNDGFTIE